MYVRAYVTGKNETHRRQRNKCNTQRLAEWTRESQSCEARVHRRAITSCPFSLERLTHLSGRCIDNPLTRFGRWLHLLPLTAWHVTSWSPESHFSSVVPRSPPYRPVSFSRQLFPSSASLSPRSRNYRSFFSYGSQSFGKFPETSPETRSLAPFLFSLLLPPFCWNLNSLEFRTTRELLPIAWHTTVPSRANTDVFLGRGFP